MADLLEFNKSKKVINVYVGLASDGLLICGNGYVPPSDYDSRTRMWYEKASSEGKPVMIDPYVDLNTNAPVVTSAVPVYGTDGKLVCVVAVDI